MTDWRTLETKARAGETLTPDNHFQLAIEIAKRTGWEMDNPTLPRWTRDLNAAFGLARHMTHDAMIQWGTYPFCVTLEQPVQRDSDRTFWMSPELDNLNGVALWLCFAYLHSVEAGNA